MSKSTNTPPTPVLMVDGREIAASKHGFLAKNRGR